MEMTSTLETPKKLFKSRRNKMIDGVCGGIAEYFDLDPTIVRVVWVLFTLLGGAGFILYIAAMIVMPANPEFPSYGTPSSAAPGQASVRNNIDNKRFWGIVLILIGALILISNLGWFAAFDWFHLSWEVMFPIMLIVLGCWFIFVYVQKPKAPFAQSGSADAAGTEPGAAQTNAWAQPRELRRSITDRKVFGVCGGIAKHFNLDPTLVRVIYVAITIASVGWGLLLYIILAFLIPEERFTDVFPG